MQKKKVLENVEDCKAVDTKTLMRILDSGRKTAIRVGTNAGARIEIGRRILWNVEKIAAYLNEVSH